MKKFAQKVMLLVSLMLVLSIVCGCQLQHIGTGSSSSDDSSSASDSSDSSSSGGSETPDPTPDEDENFYIYSIELTKTYGDSTLLKYKDFEILVDGGDNGDENQVKGALKKYVTDGKLEMIINSHPHADHVKGMQLLSTFTDANVNEVGTIIDNGCDYSSNKDFRDNVVSYFVSKGATYYDINDIMNEPQLKTMVIDDNLSIHFLESEFYAARSSGNRYSIAMYFEYKNTVVYMGGDGDNQTEASVVKLNPSFTEGKTVIFKGSHHGSKTSNSDTILNYLKPDYCFISAAMTVNNAVPVVQHPYYEAVARMAKHTKQIYWNGITGNLLITIDGVNEPTFCGEGRKVKNYTYVNESGATVPADAMAEKDSTYLNSKWFAYGVKNFGWLNLAA